jgi:opacity protein-like surface antigen
MKQQIFAALILITFASQAIAAKPTSANPPAATTSDTPAYSSSGVYFGVQLGDSTIGALMGYQSVGMFGMEINYDYVDPVYTPTTTLKKSRAGASGLARFPIKFSEMGPMALYVKVGYELYVEKYTVNNPGVPVPPASSITTETRRTGVTGGAGVHVDLSRRTSARLGVNMIGNDKSVYLSAIYRF